MESIRRLSIDGRYIMVVLGVFILHSRPYSLHYYIQMSASCNTCGNPVPDDSNVCPYCDSFDLTVDRKRIRERSVDLGHGNHTAKEAMSRLDTEIMISKRQGDDVLIIIHGHGSKGEGGQIRTLVRQYVAQLVSGRKILAFVPGEHLYVDCPQIRRLTSSYPMVTRLKDWGRENPGITVVIL